MSDTPIEVLRIKSVEPHPNADRLEIVKVLGTQFISQKGDFQEGDLCVYFPPDMLIPEHVAERLGVANYLKHSVYPGEYAKTRCRIGAIRLRGVASFGFGVSLSEAETKMAEEAFLLWASASRYTLTQLEEIESEFDSDWIIQCPITVGALIYAKKEYEQWLRNHDRAAAKRAGQNPG
jgi:RNA ligase (TIGR02306 family)